MKISDRETLFLCVNKRREKGYMELVFRNSSTVSPLSLVCICPTSHSTQSANCKSKANLRVAVCQSQEIIILWDFEFVGMGAASPSSSELRPSLKGLEARQGESKVVCLCVAL